MPVIAMTREMGSLGKEVAAAVSARLGKPVIHHEIIDHLADKMRLRKSHVIRFLDGKSSIWERLTTDKTSLSIYTADETMALVESGEVGVIRGWGAAHLLRSIPHVICVRVCAPMGLRTLSRHDPRYRARYEGGVTERDTAYHLGTVWPWLMGPFLTAYLKVNQRSEAARQQAEKWLAGFSDHLTAAGLGHICEIADGEYPHTPRGCIA